MADGLYGLRHHAVVRRHHQNRDIRGVRASHTHGSKGLMSGCIQEGDLLSVDLNGIRTDVLRDAARFLIRHIGLPDGIQKGGLTVVNVSHDADNRRSGNHILFVLLILLQELLDHINLDFLLTDDVVFNGNALRLLIGNLLIQRHDLAFHKQLLDDSCSRNLHLVSKVLDGDVVREGDHLDLLLFRLSLHRLGLDEPARLILQPALRFVLFVDVVLLRASVSFLAVTALFFLFALFVLLDGSLRSKALARSRTTGSIVLPSARALSTFSIRTLVIRARSRPACTAAEALRTPLRTARAAAGTRAILAVRAALSSCALTVPAIASVTAASVFTSLSCALCMSGIRLSAVGLSVFRSCRLRSL